MTSMTDKEGQNDRKLLSPEDDERMLLELAAKAAGIELLFWNYGHLGKSSRGTGFDVDGRIWNPLTDDGDALRLAVKLRLTIDLTDCLCCCHIYANQLDGDGPDVSVRHSEDFADCEAKDPYVATRRAIVRAAAEIGKTL